MTDYQFLIYELLDEGSTARIFLDRPRHGLDDSGGPSGEHPSYKVNGGTGSGAEYVMLQEWHHYFQSTLRWRNLRKITLAQVHEDVCAAGLMLMWACGHGGGKGHEGRRRRGHTAGDVRHPWEFGPRKTKELMLTGDSLSVDEAHPLGMVSRVFPTDQLAERTSESLAALLSP